MAPVEAVTCFAFGHWSFHWSLVRGQAFGCECRQHEGFSDNASPSWEADMAGRGFSSGSKDTGISVYVGAVASDLHPMLEADIGILVGPQPEVWPLLQAFGVEVRLLTTGARQLAIRGDLA